MKILYFILLIFIFAGCDGKIIKSVYDKSRVGVSVSAIELTATDAFSKDTAYKYLKKEGFTLGESPYRVTMEYRNYANTCNNPMVKSTGGYDYDGFAKVSLFYEGARVYAAQRDFRGEIRESLINGLLDEMIEDMELRR